MPRTDNDTWDLASSVGATATMVAAARAVATKADDAVIDDPFAEPLVRAVGVDFFTRLATGDLRPEDLDGGESPVGMRRIADGMAVRTRFFDDFFADAGRAGIRQAVILASGLDARAYRLDWPAGMVVFEIDQPEVIAFKTGDAGRPRRRADRRPRTVAIDLREDWPAALPAAGFDTTKPTAWIAEGLFGYLPPEAQDRLLDQITELSAPGSRIATEGVPTTPGRRRRRDPRADADRRRPVARPRLRHRLLRAGVPRRPQRGDRPTCSGHGWSDRQRCRPTTCSPATA